ncbi:mevalonate kinase [Mycobacterium sp. M1]|uniref:mevalonate kinase n=1 Tax=Mycolicibacter acidiphilus TaxID=2835306 RepID=A0ABS5RL83_9MYCO|nr:mevalonate kinase [Mycolicibacter acidiphilus]MBS9534986.1 mevalonate kinase [Mycolicibacter acidiphilus]
MRGEGTGRAHAKVILLGEHAVVYGVPAIATALSQLTVTTCVTRLPAGEPGEITFTPAATMPPVAEETVTSLRNLVVQFKKVTGVDDRAALALRMDSMIPPGRGLGSSAACARSVVLALADLFDVDLDAETVFDLVQYAETAAHGKSSGVDAFATGSDGLIGYVSGVAHELICGFDGVFVVADSGASGRTKDAIEHVQRMFRADPAVETEFMQRVRDLTDAGVASLTEGHPSVFGAQLSANHDVLRGIGLSTDHIEALVAAACRAGALGAKISGGGLGGCLVALAGDPDAAATVAAALRAAGAVDTWFIPVGRFADV